jgi:REP element-mobilizing transposase RayT
MSRAAEGKRYYRKNLPHFRLAGAIYHVRVSTRPGRRLTEDWMFGVVEESLLHRHKRLLSLHAYVIMANHFHAVIEPLPIPDRAGECANVSGYYCLGAIIKGIKSYSSYRINLQQARQGSLWDREYFDRTIRNEKDLVETIEYIHQNPVRWGLVRFAEEYRWSSWRTVYSGGPEYADWFD